MFDKDPSSFHGGLIHQDLLAAFTELPSVRPKATTTTANIDLAFAPHYEKNTYDNGKS